MTKKCQPRHKNPATNYIINYTDMYNYTTYNSAGNIDSFASLGWGMDIRSMFSGFPFQIPQRISQHAGPKTVGGGATPRGVFNNNHTIIPLVILLIRPRIILLILQAYNNYTIIPLVILVIRPRIILLIIQTHKNDNNILLVILLIR